MEEKLIAFLRDAEKLKSTLRHSWMSDGRKESSAEHTWRIALFFMLMNQSFPLEADPLRTLQMIIIHDLPEMMFGDIPAWMKDVDPKKHADHKVREMRAATELFAKLPSPSKELFTGLFREFEEGKTNEARLARALDRAESQLQHLDSGPAYWSKEERGEHMYHYPDSAIKNLDNPHMSKIWSLILVEIKKIT